MEGMKEYKGKLVQERKRLEEHRKKIAAQKDRLQGAIMRHKKEQERLEVQEKRIEMDKKLQALRVEGARMRGEAITGMDALEKAKITREAIWGGKWDKRKAKWDARARKYKVEEK